MAQDDQREDRDDLGDGLATDPLVRGLRAPGTAEELARQDEYVAMFASVRDGEEPPVAAEARAGGNMRRLVGRFGLGATSAVTAIALSAGVAAAYGRVLPDPVQQIAHDVLGPVGVPAPKPAKAPDRTIGPSDPQPGASPSRGPRKHGGQHRPGGLPSALPTGLPVGDPTDLPTDAPTDLPTDGATDVPTGLPTDGATEVPTDVPSDPATPAPPPPTRRPSRITIGVSTHQVGADGRVTATGIVRSRDGHRLRGRPIDLSGLVGGVWSTLASGTTDGSGRIRITSPGLTQNVRLRFLAANGVVSGGQSIVVVPRVTLAVSSDGGLTTVRISTRGGQSGDEVAVFRRTAAGLDRIGTAYLGGDGTARYAFTTPPGTTRILVRLFATGQHARAEAGATVEG